MKVNQLLSLLGIVLLICQPIFADYKISQKTTIEEMTTEITVHAKGVRERREQKTILEDVDPQTAAMMASMMPNFTTISQCDLKRDLTLSEKKKSYFIDYYDLSEVPADQLKRVQKQKIVVKGTATVSSVVTDSGKRQEMFGLTARWLKHVISFETSADSCDGKSDLRTEQEGWFVDLKLSSESCRLPRFAGSGQIEDCRPKMIVKAMQDPGFFLEGTTRMYESNKLQMTSKLQTTALSTAILDQALFEIPLNYTEVDSLSALMQGGNGLMDAYAATNILENKGQDKSRAGTKNVGIDFFSGNYSKVDQDGIRQSMMEDLNKRGFATSFVTSAAEITNGRFDFVVGVEIVSSKQSKSGKLGGLFGKVTGTSDASKAGDSEVEVLVTVYQKDGKTVVAQQSAKQKSAGTPDDAASAAIAAALNQLAGRMK